MYKPRTIRLTPRGQAARRAAQWNTETRRLVYETIRGLWKMAQLSNPVRNGPNVRNEETE